LIDRARSVPDVPREEIAKIALKSIKMANKSKPMIFNGIKYHQISLGQY
jgi:hypothetical protein